MRKATEGREEKISCVYVVVQRTVRENAAMGGQAQIMEDPKCQAKKLGFEAVKVLTSEANEVFLSFLNLIHRLNIFKG